MQTGGGRVTDVPGGTPVDLLRRMVRELSDVEAWRPGGEYQAIPGVARSAGPTCRAIAGHPCLLRTSPQVHQLHLTLMWVVRTVALNQVPTLPLHAV